MSWDANSPGSRWLKFDFHTHTPASEGDYGRGDSSCKETTPEKWLEHAMRSNLDCVAVTDHHSGDWVDKLKEENSKLKCRDEKPEWYRELAIYPGFEITISESKKSVHLLALFDPSRGSSDVSRALGACGVTSGHGDAQDTYTNKSVIDVIKAIKSFDGIAIPAHIDAENGLLNGVTTLTPGAKEWLGILSAAEFCDPNKFDNADSNLKNAIERLAKVGGSDAHKPDGIGRYFSWVKMGQPTIDCLEIALQDHEYSIKNQDEDPNTLPSVYLSRLEIKKMRHCGQVDQYPFVARFSTQFNSIIGGRGAGKSTILESIRIVSNHHHNLEKEAPRIKDELDKFMKPVHQGGVMQDDTELLLYLNRSGIDYRLQWKHSGEDWVLQEKVDKEWIQADTSNLRERFQISVFSQRQIHELASNTQGLLEIIDRSLDADVTEWQSRWKIAKSQFLQLRESQRSLSSRLGEEPQIRERLRDIENDLKQYQDKGHGEVLKQYQTRNLQKNGLPKDEAFAKISSAIRETASSVEIPDFPGHLFDDQDETKPEIQELYGQSALAMDEIRKTLIQLADSVDTINKQLSNNILSSKWHRAFDISIDNYDNLLKEYKDKNISLDIATYAEWVQQRGSCQNQLAQFSSIRKDLELVEKQLIESSSSLMDLRKELCEKREQFLQKILHDNPYVRIKLVPFGDTSSLVEDYREKLHLTESTFDSQIIGSESAPGILWDMLNWEEKNISPNQLPDIISKIKSFTRKIALGQESGGQRFNNRINRVFDTQPVAFDNLDAWWPDDLLQVQYSTSPTSGKFENLKRGSAGQKASAILAFLLSHGDGPLIIDQPEDDLDNALIYDLIVRQISINKNKRQLIIATHNPNIVVNGDSELVTVMEFKNNQVKIALQGGIAEKNIREKICQIMEGGWQAFEKRYNRLKMDDKHV